MNINFENLKEIYGDEILDVINENIDIIEANVKTMQELGFDDVEDLLEKNIDSFLFFPNNFKNKMEELIKEVGPNYVDVIENDMSYMDKIL
ncbi:MAG: hypothetical protein IKP28_05190 [Clostridia bacterium]|nr:hypothetical protein [Clostridia bacterium]